MHLREEGYALLPTEISDQPGGVFDQGGYSYASRLWAGLKFCRFIVFDHDNT